MKNKKILVDAAQEMLELITKETRGDIELQPFEMNRLEELAYTVLNAANNKK